MPEEPNLWRGLCAPDQGVAGPTAQCGSAYDATARSEDVVSSFVGLAELVEELIDVLPHVGGVGPGVAEDGADA